jgi:hypothetical protein
MEVLGDKGGRGLLQDSSCDLGAVFGVLGDKQLCKEELVRQAPDLRTPTTVDFVAATYQGKALISVSSIRAKII